MKFKVGDHVLFQEGPGNRGHIRKGVISETKSSYDNFLTIETEDMGTWFRSESYITLDTYSVNEKLIKSYMGIKDEI